MKRSATITSVLLTLALPIAATCADTPAGKAAAAKEISKSGHSMMTGGAAGAEEANINVSGKVIETMEGGGYTYARLEKNGKKTWVAFTGRTTSIGETLTFNGCMEMPNFQSKALNRKFDSILFCNQPVEAKQGASKQLGKNSPGSGGAAASAAKVKVTKATGANAFTVAEIYAKGNALNGKKVQVRGQVVKVSPKIMDRNWVHLQDGTGDEKKKTHDLVVTSDEAPTVGDVVTVTGVVARNKDFGGGYKYNAIIEQGKFFKK